MCQFHLYKMKIKQKRCISKAISHYFSNDLRFKHLPLKIIYLHFFIGVANSSTIALIYTFYLLNF